MSKGFHPVNAFEQSYSVSHKAGWEWDRERWDPRLSALEVTLPGARGVYLPHPFAPLSTRGSTNPATGRSQFHSFREPWNDGNGSVLEGKMRCVFRIKGMKLRKFLDQLIDEL